MTRASFAGSLDDAGYRTDAPKESDGEFGWNEERKTFEQSRRFNWQNTGFDQTDDHPVVNVN